MSTNPTTPAADAGSELGWALASRPSQRQKNTDHAELVRLVRLTDYRDDAETDPASFVRALFDALAIAASDAADTVRDEMPRKACHEPN